MLDASASSDPEDGPLTYHWEQISDPPLAIIRDEDAAITTVDPPDDTRVTRTFRVTVTDRHGSVATDEVTIAPK